MLSPLSLLGALRHTSYANSRHFARASSGVCQEFLARPPIGLSPMTLCFSRLTQIMGPLNHSYDGVIFEETFKVKPGTAEVKFRLNNFGLYGSVFGHFLGVRGGT